jgi:hypothetical protein
VHSSLLRRIIAGTTTRRSGVVGDEVAGEILRRLDAARLAIVHESDLEILIDAARFRSRRVAGQLFTRHMDLALFLGERLLIGLQKDKSGEETRPLDAVKKAVDLIGQANGAKD